MTQLNPDFAAQVLATCRAGAEKIAAALGRALDRSIAVGPVESGVYDATAPGPGCAGPGLAVLLAVGDSSVAAVLAASSGLLPAWSGEPDATVESQLATLAQELSLLLLPEAVASSGARAAFVPNLASALAAAGAATGAATVALPISSDGAAASLILLGPLPEPEKLLAPSGGAGLLAAHDVAAPPTSALDPTPQSQAEPRIADLRQLPGYARSLLKISVPVSVQLAAKKESVQEVISLAPGSIIKFEKNCEELLQMIVGEHPVAEGEAVKIGEKFGFRVSSMLLPPEHFVPATRKRA
ncbi:MAG: FliM/FliN family flagellar motor switch protein [Pirellulales bacterium]|nr:FliM/FliN family flagellar motor switch protein [Pirellulales bacterium]